MRHVRTGLLALCAASLAPGCTFLHRVEHAAHLGRTPTDTVASAANPAAQIPVPGAQTDTVEPPVWLYNDIACAPSLTTQAAGALRVVGSQDPTIKHLMGPGDTLVISGGASAGLQPG